MVFGISEKSLMPQTAETLSHPLLHFPKLDRDIFRHRLSHPGCQGDCNLIFTHRLRLLSKPTPPKELRFFQSRPDQPQKPSVPALEHKRLGRIFKPRAIPLTNAFADFGECEVARRSFL